MTWDVATPPIGEVRLNDLVLSRAVGAYRAGERLFARFYALLRAKGGQIIDATVIEVRRLRLALWRSPVGGHPYSIERIGGSVFHAGASHDPLCGSLP